MRWEILAGHGKQDGPDVDGELWLYEAGRGTETRRVEVLITGQARLSENPQIRRGVESSGQRTLLDVLDEIGEGEPPRRITITHEGITSTSEATEF